MNIYFNRLVLCLVMCLLYCQPRVFAENLTFYETALTDDPCEDFHCENRGQCQTLLSEVDDRVLKHAECICHDRWIGPHCESLLVLTPRRITEYSVELRITLQNSNLSEWQYDPYLKYTLQYWTNESDTCYKIPGITNLTYEISDLISGVYYNFCARTNIVDQCLTEAVDPNSLTSNCIGIVTDMANGHKQDEIETGPPVLPIVICTILVALCIIAVLVVFKCNDNLASYRCSGIKCCRKWSRQSAYDLFVLPDNTCTAVSNQTPLIVNQGQHQTQSLAILMDSSNSTQPATHSSFPLPPDFDITEQNLERTESLIPQQNEPHSSA
ncbi:uncharacterized protein LOC106867519 [Octopus bimaculoides]|uniref:EGF-like domain-containing protein n=1 Tax=Octopus bimaculoides TaxID=37653 RepID=A0A0L8I086_OCTBM|nr:uncharacterized protein LOC106867519 [Octopus bimaculoides]XP_014767897.1 uncharacterized protein LOC106867519 [Octopus bimaculoides]XP_014767898.1 uncharacterized protein LOC106867519 [Octopus bimaculoides]XP_014767899.1 uncharacterized protein LOC106867519 [Octopus bimaculoides]XP_052827233.1 uncharacterized protein LOC106867519 [Octopus bimaculoides]XP_052827234.1 uncharacterized protein LOC106867519 [Octopus bimaculoides]XP_052827236.1 uncharacterized protein LOC106867519 [Octopus bima|eukprot:XP_014767893.1 PREDICTED: uncharacterized protein LOC106867519 [Octopus bimaculoides]